MRSSEHDVNKAEAGTRGGKRPMSGRWKGSLLSLFGTPPNNNGASTSSGDRKSKSMLVLPLPPNNDFKPFAMQLPPLVEKSINWIEEYGLLVPGIFQVTPEYKHILEQKQRFESDSTVELAATCNPHVIASVLKVWFCELPSPIFTYELYSACVACLATTDPTNQNHRIGEVLKCLPPANKHVLMKLTKMLHQVDKHKETNSTSAETLAIIFASALIRTATNSLKSLVDDAPTVIRLVHALIVDYERFFTISDGSRVVVRNNRASGRLSAEDLSFFELIHKARNALAQHLVSYKEWSEKEERMEEEKKREFLDQMNQLEAVLKYPFSRSFFRNYVIENEFSEDSLQFWIEVETYRNLREEDTQKRVEMMKKIYMTHISMRGERQISITPDLRQAIIAQVKQGSASSALFDEARNWVVKLMKSTTFPNFLRSRYFKMMLQEMKQLDPVESSLMQERNPTLPPSGSSGSLNGSYIRHVEIKEETVKGSSGDLDNLAAELRRMHADLLEPLSLGGAKEPGSSARRSRSDSSLSTSALVVKDTTQPESNKQAKPIKSQSQSQSQSHRTKDKRDKKDKKKEKERERSDTNKKAKIRPKVVLPLPLESITGKPSSSSTGPQEPIQPQYLTGIHQLEWNILLGEFEERRAHVRDDLLAKEEIERKALEDQYLLQLSELRTRWAEEKVKAEQRMTAFFEEQKAKFEEKHRVKLTQTESNTDDSVEHSAPKEPLSSWKKIDPNAALAFAFEERPKKPSWSRIQFNRRSMAL